MTPCILVGWYRNFGGPSCRPHRTNGNRRFLRNALPELPNCTTLHRTRQQRANVADTCVLLLRTKQHLIMCKYITLCFACCVIAMEKGTDFVTTLNRLIKANKWHVCWTVTIIKRCLLHIVLICAFPTAVVGEQEA